VIPVRVSAKKNSLPRIKNSDNFFFFLGVNPSSFTDECACANVGMSCSQLWCKNAIFGD
jgi:hypothetical protein